MILFAKINRCPYRICTECCVLATILTINCFLFFCPCVIYRVQRPLLHARYPTGHGVPSSRDRTATITRKQPITLSTTTFATANSRHCPYALRGRNRTTGRSARTSRQTSQTSQVSLYNIISFTISMCTIIGRMNEMRISTNEIPGSRFVR